MAKLTEEKLRGRLSDIFGWEPDAIDIQQVFDAIFDMGYKITSMRHESCEIVGPDGECFYEIADTWQEAFCRVVVKAKEGKERAAQQAARVERKIVMTHTSLLQKPAQRSRGVLAPDEETILCIRCGCRAYETELPIPRGKGELGFYCRECIGYRAEEVIRDRDIRHFIAAQRRAGVEERNIKRYDPATAYMVCSTRYNESFWRMLNEAQGFIASFGRTGNRLCITAGIASVARARFWRGEFEDTFAEERAA